MDLENKKIKCSECTEKICEECVKLAEAREMNKQSKLLAIGIGAMAYFLMALAILTAIDKFIN